MQILVTKREFCNCTFTYRICTCQHLYATVRWRYINNNCHYNCGDSCIHPRISLGKEFGGIEKISAARMSLVSVESYFLSTQFHIAVALSMCYYIYAFLSCCSRKKDKWVYAAFYTLFCCFSSMWIYCKTVFVCRYFNEWVSEEECRFYHLSPLIDRYFTLNLINFWRNWSKCTSQYHFKLY